SPTKRCGKTNLVERRASVTHHLLHRWLIADAKGVRSRFTHEVGAILECERGVVDRRRVQLWLAEGEAEFREMGHLLGLPAGGLEQDRGADAPVDVAKRSLGISVERLAVGLLASDVGIDRGD